MRQSPRPEPAIRDPADRTRLAWTRTALAFAALGAGMLKSSPLEGAVVLALSVPVWAAVRGKLLPRSPRGLLVITVIVAIVAVVALAVAVLGSGPASVGQLLHGR